MNFTLRGLYNDRLRATIKEKLFYFYITTINIFTYIVK